MRTLQRKEQVILGIDPGTTVMGYGVIKTVGNKATLLTMGVIDFKDCDTHYDKLNKICQLIIILITMFSNISDFSINLNWPDIINKCTAILWLM
jgi:hypothetical protein